MKLNGKAAIVTGGASGLGEATVRQYHAQEVKNVKVKAMVRNTP